MHLVLRAVREPARAGALVGRGHAVLAIHVGTALTVGVRHATAIVAWDPRRLAGQDLAAVVELKDSLPGLMFVTVPDRSPVSVAVSLDG